MKKIAKYALFAAVLMMPVASMALTVTEYDVDLGTSSPEDMVISIINWVLGLLALIAVVLIIIGGFMWMTAGGNEEKVGKAKKILISAVIGLVIILAAWGLSVYAINILSDTTV